MAAVSHLVPDRRGAASAKVGNSKGSRSPGEGKKGAIEQAYTSAAEIVWCQDEAGPYQSKPHPGASWCPQGQPARQPHEWFRGGTAKMLTLFHPQTGELRARAVGRTTNAELHPWLKAELSAALEQAATAKRPMTPIREWSAWGISQEEVVAMEAPPQINLILVWDNLRGHYTREMVKWCHKRGILLLYTPLGGSWLNMAESIQRIVVRRAIIGRHLETAEDVKEALEASVRGWNRAPTPFVWGGKRSQRRERARQRRYALGGSGACALRSINRQRAKSLYHTLINVHARDK
jgi:transposase